MRGKRQHRGKPGLRQFGRSIVRSPARALAVSLLLATIGYVGLHISNAAVDDAPLPAGNTGSAEEIAASQVIVRYKADADEPSVRNKMSKLGAREADSIPSLRVRVLKVPVGAREAVLASLRTDPQVEYAEPDSVTEGTVTKPNDPEYTKQWSWPKTQTDLAWDRTKGSALIVAVTDTGINMGHSEFTGRILPGSDLVNNDDDPTDDNGHGSNVAGVVAAAGNNGTGVAGGCWNCRLLPVKVLDSQNKGTTSVLAKGITYAADNGAKIINVSVSSTAADETLRTAVDYATGKQILVVASAGNTAKDQQLYPAAFENSLSVAATENDDTLTSYSTFGAHVDIAAPGFARTTSFTGSDYNDNTGTSFSAPTVSAIAALVWTLHPQATMAQVRDSLTKTADTCCAAKIGGGRVNAAKALDYLADTNFNDLNGDGKINITDLSILLTNWGKAGVPADLNKSGKVDITDLSILLSNWTR